MSPALFVAFGGFGIVLVVSILGRAVLVFVEPGVVSVVREFVFVEPIGAGTGNVVLI